VVLLAPDVASYSYVPSNAWTMVPILFVASVFIEWPLFVRAVKNGSLKLSAASLRYTFYAQCVSYLLLIPLYATYDERLPVKDLVAMDLENLFANAYQYRLRPASMGGGEGSYAGYSISPSLASTEYGTYSVRVLHPDTVKFHARASEDTTWTVTVKIGPDGRPVAGSWVYTGQFV
jgi:hypothetical protein